jgi:hypothetical protein
MRGAGICVLAVWLSACAAYGADSRSKIVSVTTTATNAATTVSQTFSVNGYLESIIVDPPAGSPTGSVTIAYQPKLSTASAISLVAKTGLTAETVFRPRVDTTTIDGTANTGDDPEKFMLSGEVITFSVTDANVTSATWNVYFKWLNK